MITRSLLRRTLLHATILIGAIAATMLPVRAVPSSARNVGMAVTTESIKRLARAVLSMPGTSMAPAFSIRKETLYYYLGEVVLPDALPVSGIVDHPIAGADPLRIPVRDRARIELLREGARRNIDSGLASLDLGLDRAENVIADELAMIEEHVGSRETLLDALDEKSSGIDAILDSRLREIASERHLNLYKTTRKALADIQEVTFVSLPPGGVISIVLDFDFRVALRAAKSPPWRLVSQTGKVSLPAGSYRVRVVWPVNLTKPNVSECTIDIMTDGPLQLRPIPAEACS